MHFLHLVEWVVQALQAKYIRTGDSAVTELLTYCSQTVYTWKYSDRKYDRLQLCGVSDNHLAFVQSNLFHKENRDGWKLCSRTAYLLPFVGALAVHIGQAVKRDRILQWIHNNITVTLVHNLDGQTLICVWEIQLTWLLLYQLALPCLIETMCLLVLKAGKLYPVTTSPSTSTIGSSKVSQPVYQWNDSLPINWCATYRINCMHILNNDPTPFTTRTRVQPSCW